MPLIYTLVLYPKTKAIIEHDLPVTDDLQWFEDGVLERVLNTDKVWTRCSKNLHVAYGATAAHTNEHAVTIIGSEWLDGSPKYRARTFAGPVAVYGAAEDEDDVTYLTQCPVSVPWLLERVIWSAIDKPASSEIEP